MRRAVLVLAVVAVLAGCDGIDEPWELDHDRVIAVRATPPRIPAGAQATIDALLGRRGASPIEAAPASASVLSPPSLAGALRLEDGRWLVTALDDGAIASARAELGLAAEAPVPLLVEVAFDPGAFPSGAVTRELVATKTVWLGDAAENPVLGDVYVGGAAAPPQELAVDRGVDVRLSIEVVEPDDARWLSSCGSVHDYDLPQAYLRVEPDDPDTGDLALVVRTHGGGVAWLVWSLRAR